MMMIMIIKQTKERNRKKGSYARKSPIKDL